MNSLTTELLVTLCLTSSLALAEAPIDKSQYTLFNPTPLSAMREMSTDRPDTTESPITVDAGHIQVELSFVEYTRNKDAGVTSESTAILPTNLKIGLLNNVDVQLVFTPYEHQRFEAGGSSQSTSGFSDDTQIRLKINLWGNDAPDPNKFNTSFALMPFIKFPTGSGDLSNDHVEGGLIIPLATDLPHDWTLGLMAEVDAVYNESTGDYGIDFVHTATIGHDFPGTNNVGFYLEYIGISPYETGATYQAIASAGVTVALSDNWIIDFGGRAGISKSADDFTVFVGTSFRH